MAYYVIKSKLSNFVLDAEGGGKDGHKVIAYDRSDHDNQLWYDDCVSNTIRLKDGNLVMGLDKHAHLVVEKDKGTADQKWKREGEHIRNGFDNNKVIDILGDDKSKGAKVGAYAYHGKKNQCFEFIFVGGEAPVAAPLTQPGGVRRQFYIVSELNGRVLDVAGAKKDAGAKVVVYDKQAAAAPNQLWYIDQHGYIRSALNDMTFTSTKAGEPLKMHEASGDPRNQWTIQGRKVGNRAGECLDIRGEDDDNAASVCSYEFNDKTNQHWSQQYV